MYLYFIITDVPEAPINVMSSCISSNDEVSVMNISWNYPNDLYLDHYEISMKNAVYSARGNFMVIVLNGEKQVLTIKAVDICNQASVPISYECKLILHCSSIG